MKIFTEDMWKLMIFHKLTDIKWLLSSQALKQDGGINFTTPH